MTIHLTTRNQYGALTKMRGTGGTKEDWKKLIKARGWVVVKIELK